MSSSKDSPRSVRRAVALRYESNREPAPRVVAGGAGPMAERIIHIAREADVPLHEDPDLVEVLAALEVGDLIPADLYAAVAQVLAFLYRLGQGGAPAQSPRSSRAESDPEDG